MAVHGQTAPSDTHDSGVPWAPPQVDGGRPVAHGAREGAQVLRDATHGLREADATHGLREAEAVRDATHGLHEADQARRDTTPSLREAEPPVPDSARGVRFLRPPLRPSGASTPRLLTRHPSPAGRPLYVLLEGKGSGPLHLAVDLLAAFLGVGLATLITPGPSGTFTPAILALPLVLALVMHLRGMYRRRMHIAILDGIAPIAGAVSVSAMAVLAFEVFIRSDAAAAPLVERSWPVVIVLVVAARSILGSLQRAARARGVVARPALIVGAGMVGDHVARRLEERPEYGLRPIGYLDADPPPAEHRRLPILGAPDELATIVAQTGAEHVILAFSSAPDSDLVQLTRRCDELGVEASLVPRLFESINDRVALERLGALPLLGLRAIDPKGWQFKVKYALDRPIALLALIAWLPVFALAALAVKLSSPGPILFRQRRVGLDGRTFDLLKFRSMRVEEPHGPGFVPAPERAPGGVEGEDRRTPLGRLLRRTGVDELPQLINVLKGEMSLVGPRPERPEFVEMFDQDYRRYSDRHRVRSGITGWAQVNGLRGQTSLADRVEWDNFYIENWSLWLDFKVLLLTIRAVLLHQDG